jgi:hypothetical protein
MNREVLESLGTSTAFIERTNLTSRLFNGRQVRKTLAFSKNVGDYRASAIWEDSYYSLFAHTRVCAYRLLVVFHRNGSLGHLQMAAGLTDHIGLLKNF